MGVDISGSEARLVILDGTKASFRFVDCDPRKLALDNDDDATMVRSFRDTLQAFVGEQHVQKVAIKARTKKGDHAGGPTGFKIEGIIQLTDGCDVALAWPASIAASKRRHTLTIPANLKKYQHDAYEKDVPRTEFGSIRQRSNASSRRRKALVGVATTLLPAQICRNLCHESK
jgi:hypothetical protein